MPKTVKSNGVSLAVGHELKDLMNGFSRSQAIIEFELDGTIITANDNFCNALGYSLNEIKGKHHSLFVDTEYGKSKDYEEFWAKLARGEFHAGSFRRIKKNCDDIWIQATYNPILNEKGEVYKVVKLATDITEQMQKQVKDNKESQRLKAMIDQSPSNTMYADRDLNLIYMNPASAKTLKTVEEYLPKPVDQLIGQSIDIFHKDPEHQRKILSDIKNLPVHTFIEVGPETLELDVSAVLDSEGEWIGTMVNWSVVTEKLRAEERAQRYRSTVENAPINIMLADRDLNLIYMNPASEKTLRSIQEHLPMSVDEMKGKCIDLFHKDPSHQRKLLADPANLPIRTKINVGPEILDLLVSAVTDQDGNYKYAMASWSVVTQNEKLAKEVSDVVQVVTSSTEQMKASGESMASGAEESSKQAQAVAAASEQAARNVQSVASAAEEMSASIKEISNQVQKSADIAKEAVERAESTKGTMSKLNDSSQDIGQVVKVITSIAQQTNLLALNATIEAARAGEAGKGFAVVANEVKELARQTAKATEEISQKISGVQEDTSTAVAAIESIGKVINNINEISNTISTSINEQTAATTEISRNCSEASKGTEEVTRNIAEVSQVAEKAGREAAEGKVVADKLSDAAGQLSQAVDSFVNKSE